MRASFTRSSWSHWTSKDLIHWSGSFKNGTGFGGDTGSVSPTKSGVYAFWPIMSALYELNESGYVQKTDELAKKGVAVWDVLQACFRSGSLDANIDDSTIVTNDFCSFFAGHTGIGKIFFNGAKAETVYRKHVLPQLDPRWSGLPMKRLPSTSPANAGMNLQQTCIYKQNVNNASNQSRAALSTDPATITV